MSSILLVSPIEGRFEPTPHLESDGTESLDTIDIAAGSWLQIDSLVPFAATANLGSETNKYIIANRISGYIEAVSTIPGIIDRETKRLLVELVFATYTPGTGEYPDNPSYSGSKVLAGWIQHQFGDIYDGVLLDTRKYGTPSGTGRKTLVTNAESGSHAGEQQIFGVETVQAQAGSIPFFVAEAEDAEAHAYGAIDWMAFDSSVYGLNKKSLSKYTDGTYGDIFELNDFHLYGTSRYKVPFKDVVGADEVVAWEFIATWEGLTPGTGNDTVITGLTGGGSGDVSISFTPSARTITVGDGKIDVGVESTLSPITCSGSVDWDNIDPDVIESIIDDYCDQTWWDSFWTGSSNKFHDMLTFRYDDHDGSSGGGPESGSPAQYLELTATRGTSSRNNMGGVIGRADASLSLSPNLGTAHDSNGVAVINWNYANAFHILAAAVAYLDNTTDASAINTAGTVLAGGLAVAKHTWGKSAEYHNGNYSAYFAGPASATNRAGYFTNATMTATMCGSTYVMDTYGGGINVQSGQSYFHNGTAGLTDATGNMALVDKSTGKSRTVYIRGGLVCAS